jgi:hypothetical protein
MTSSSRCLNRNQSRAKVSLSIEYIFLLLFVPQKSQMLARLTSLFLTIVASVVTPIAQLTSQIFMSYVFFRLLLFQQISLLIRGEYKMTGRLHRLAYL